MTPGAGPRGSAARGSPGWSPISVRWRIRAERLPDSVQDMEHMAMVLMMMAPGIVTSIVVGARAKSINAAWRERRDRRLAAR